MIRILLFTLLFSTSVFAAATKSNDDTSASASDQIKNLYDKDFSTNSIALYIMLKNSIPIFC